MTSLTTTDDSFAWKQQAAAVTVTLNELQAKSIGSSRKLQTQVQRGGLGCANRNAVQNGNVQVSGRNGQENTLGILRDLGLQEQLREWWRQVEVDAGLETEQARSTMLHFDLFGPSQYQDHSACNRKLNFVREIQHMSL